jgi:hypothetical protein
MVVPLAKQEMAAMLSEVMDLGRWNMRRSLIWRRFKINFPLTNHAKIFTLETAMYSEAAARSLLQARP